MTGAERLELRQRVSEARVAQVRAHRLAEAACAKRRGSWRPTQWRGTRGQARQSIVPKFRELIGHDPAGDPLVKRLRATMPGESTIDLDEHAARLAFELHLTVKNTEPGVTFHGAAPGSDTKGL